MLISRVFDSWGVPRPFHSVRGSRGHNSAPKSREPLGAPGHALTVAINLENMLRYSEIFFQEFNKCNDSNFNFLQLTRMKDRQPHVQPYCVQPCHTMYSLMLLTYRDIGIGKNCASQGSYSRQRAQLFPVRIDLGR